MFKTLSSKGQLVLPAAYRRRVGLKAGSRIRIVEDGERLILEPMSIRRSRFVESDGCERPILSVREGGVIHDTELIDPLDDE